MPTVEELLRRAAEYRRIAPHCTTPGLTAELLALAADLERAAEPAPTTTVDQATADSIQARQRQGSGQLRSDACAVPRVASGLRSRLRN